MSKNGSRKEDLLVAVGGGEFMPLGRRRRLEAVAGEAIRFDLASGGCWYGQGFSHRQPYPLNREPVVNEQFAVNNTQSPIWMCSKGLAVLADTNEQLSVRINAGPGGALEVACPAAGLSLEVIAAANLPAAHRRLMARLGWPNRPPRAQLLGDSIFCTWTQYPRCITQGRIEAMAVDIRKHAYPCSVLTIDDRWESTFGELEFSGDFPNPRAMVQRLHGLGFKVLLWVTPFVNREAKTFADLAARKILAPRKDGTGAALLKWWGGTAGLVDLTNPAGRRWYRQQILRLKNEIGVDGFKIDGGDAKYQPPAAETAWHDYKGPSGYADELLGLFEEIAPGQCETRTVWLSQRRDILWRQGGKDSHWGVDNGLAALVRLGMQMALLGYDIQMPDMVPGRVGTMVSNMALPTDELMVRWTEASAFFPILQFSYFPWNYGPATAKVSLAYAQAHKAMQGYLAAEAKNRSAPLLRPLWYDSPRDQALYSVDDEFCLGGDVLVAPVLEPNQVARDVLLPAGRWLDAWTGQTFGGGLLQQHPSPCPGMPIFVRQRNRPLFEKLHKTLKTISRGSVAPGVTSTTYVAGLDRDLSVTG